jgi:hypothetical protein
VYPVSADFDMATGAVSVAVAVAGVALLWRGRKSVVLSLLFLGAPLLLHRNEILLTQTRFGEVPVNLADVVVFAYCAVQGVAALARGRRGVWVVRPEWVVLLAVTALGAGIGVYFENPTYQLLQSARALLFLIGTFAATYVLVDSENDIKDAVKMLLLWGVMTSITIWRYGLMNAAQTAEAIAQYNSGLVMSTVVDAIGTAHAVVVTACLLSLGYVLFAPRFRSRTVGLCLALTVVFFATLVFSGVRTTWVQVAIATAYIVVVSKRLTLRMLGAVAIGLLVGGAVTVVILNSVLKVDGRQMLAARADVSESFEGRMVESREAIDAVNRRGNWVFGNGLGAQFAYKNPYKLETELSASAHNAYVTYYLDLGIAGLIAIAVIIWRVYSTTWAGFRSPKRLDMRWMCLGANAALVASCIGALSSNVFGITPDGYFNVGTAALWAIAIRAGRFALVPDVGAARPRSSGAEKFGEAVLGSRSEP